jgi:hypothetical protein
MIITQQGNIKISKHLTGLGVIVFNATCNNISAILWLSVLLLEETAAPGENHRPATDKRFHIMLYREHLA